MLPEGQEIVVYKNNSDGKGNSYGCHENYLMARHVPFGRIVAHVIPHFVTRQIFTGAGQGRQRGARASASTTCRSSSRQRADFFEEEVGLETTLKRPIVNTRDEPHCDATKYRRLHVIVGDANLSEVVDVPEGRHDRHRAGHDRRRRAAARVRVQRAGVGDAPRVLRPRPACAARAGRRHHRHRARGAVGAARPGPEVRRLGRPGLRGRERRRRGAPPVGGRAHRARGRPDVAGRSARLGGQVPPASRATASATAWPGTTPAWPRWTSSTTTSGRTSPSSPASASSASPTTTRWPWPSPSRRPTPGPISGESASSAGATTSWPPTGTHLCSTLAANLCVACR